MKRKRKVKVTGNKCLFMDGPSRTSFIKAVPGDIIDITYSDGSLSVIVGDRGESSIQCPCALAEYTALCSHALCDHMTYTKLDDILERL